MFFISADMPRLHVKQCHMLARFLTTYAKRITKKTAFTGPVEHKINYLQWNHAIGRIGEAVPDNSLTQKIKNKTPIVRLNNASMDLVPGDSASQALFNEHSLDHNTNAKNFLAGVNELQTNTLMKKYLHNHGIVSDTQTTLFEEYNSLMSAPIWLGSLND
jgi:hypothetical protein